MKAHVNVDDAKLQMAPMIDMVFLLIIFFMTASHLSSNQSIRMDMATASRAVIPKDRPDRWTVNVMADGTIFSGMQAVSLDELKTMVAQGVKDTPNLKAYIRADALTRHLDVKKVMNVMAAGGIADFIFGVYNPEAGQTE